MLGGFHIGVPWHLDDTGDAVLDLHRGHHIGTAAHHVAAQHQHPPLAEAELQRQAAELSVQLPKGRERGAQAQRRDLLMPQHEAQGDPKPKAPKGEASPLGDHGSLATTEELRNRGQARGWGRFWTGGTPFASLAPSDRGL